jgi:hypothetical protein
MTSGYAEDSWRMRMGGLSVDRTGDERPSTSDSLRRAAISGGVVLPAPEQEGSLTPAS